MIVVDAAQPTTFRHTHRRSSDIIIHNSLGAPCPQPVQERFALWFPRVIHSNVRQPVGNEHETETLISLTQRARVQSVRYRQEKTTRWHGIEHVYDVRIIPSTDRLYLTDLGATILPGVISRLWRFQKHRHIPMVAWFRGRWCSLNEYTCREVELGMTLVYTHHSPPRYVLMRKKHSQPRLPQFHPFRANVSRWVCSTRGGRVRVRPFRFFFFVIQGSF